MPHILLGIVICAQTGCTTWNILFSVLRLQKGHHQWMIRSSAHPLFNPGPTPQGSLESKRDPGTWNWTQCAGPPPVDDPLISSPTVQPRTHPPRVLWNPKEIQAPGMGLRCAGPPPADDDHPLPYCSTKQWLMYPLLLS
jgi:hypothetical protein